MIMAVPQVLAMKSLAETEQDMRTVLQKMNNDLKLKPEELEELAGWAAELAPYVPVVLALVVTVIAGMCGLLTVGYLRRRAASAMPPPTPPSAQP